MGHACERNHSIISQTKTYLYGRNKRLFSLKQEGMIIRFLHWVCTLRIGCCKLIKCVVYISASNYTSLDRSTRWAEDSRMYTNTSFVPRWTFIAESTLPKTTDKDLQARSIQLGIFFMDHMDSFLCKKRFNPFSCKHWIDHKLQKIGPWNINFATYCIN